MWPWTIWPPILSVGCNANSRLTESSTTKSPKFVLEIVSNMTSTWNELSSTLIAVRQTPFTLILSPVFISEEILGVVIDYFPF